ncbi:Shedu anti-phage system protein SduA domain-containing protein [Psychrobacter immobilis]|jgi:hypothetical protein|uniref:Shedu anti-phage system protein SduA domain-containing protein n=1 Tax=Psychrobacter immobilis TaxID=498 RepID=UPI00191AD691|nr:DUF4263 domain-containing protein [Psychrobacter immobilis]
MSSAEQLWTAIYDFYCLLVSKNNEEASYQRLFEQHPAIFTVLGIDTAASFEKSSPNTLPYDQDRGFNPEPDFIGAEFEAGILTVVELKTPFVGNITTSRNDGNRAKFKALAETYISQTTEYVESIRQNREARDVVKKVLNVSKTSDYRAKLIYALSAENDAHLVSSIMAQRKVPTEIVFYDDLFDRMVKAYSIGRSDNLSRVGWCFVTHIYLGNMQASGKTFIADYGSGSADRISVCLDNNEIIFECFDSQQKVYSLQALLDGRGPHYIRFEFSNDSNGIYMSLNVNNIESELRLGKGVLKLFPETEFFTLGADSSGNNGAHFYMLEHYFVNKTISLVDKLGSFRYFQQKVNKSSHCLEFKPKDYMIRQSSGHMIQELDACKPIFRDWPLIETKV